VAKGVNGTIDNSTQTTVQRNTQTNRNNNSGISSRLGVADDTYYSSSTGLFPDSPVNNVAKRNLVDREDRGNLFRTDAAGDPDVYNAYRKVVDRDSYPVGYGFDAISPAYMNYSHPDNPFIQDEVLNLDTLKSGSPHIIDEKIINYRGAPDPVVNDISDPETEIVNTDNLRLDERKNNDLYGSESSEYREFSQTTLVTNNTDGAFVYEDSIDTIGKYFTNNY
jgi:hypothetical protein